MRIKWFLLLVALSVVGCGQKQGAGKVAPADQAAPAPVSVSTGTQTVDAATAGLLKGVVRFEGALPEVKDLSVAGNPECSVFHQGGKVKNEAVLVENGLIQNAFVYIKEGLSDYRFDPPAEAVVIDNKTCIYMPHVSGAQVNQAVTFTNEDPTLHNVHSYSQRNKGFNLGMPFKGMKVTKKFDAPEIMIQLKCDVHPWMLGYVGVVAHPYFAVTGPDGSFELKNVPPGTYGVEVWHEKFGVQSQTITIEPQKTASIEFKFSA